MTLLEFVQGALSGSGVMGLVVVWYEYWQRRKERAKDYLAKFVLTPDFYQYESLMWTLCDLYRAYGKINSGKSATVILHGELVIIQTLDDWRYKKTEVWLQIARFAAKLEETGVRFHMPKKIRMTFAGISLATGQFQKEIDGGRDVSELVKKVEDQLWQISHDVRKSLGTLGL